MPAHITHNLDNLIAGLTAAERKQVPIALAKALTRTGVAVKAAEVDTMRRVFDRPTRFTLNGLFLKPATKAKPEALVWLRDWAPKGTPATQYLAPQIDGGQRRHKKLEGLLLRRGLIRPGEFIQPGKSMKLDAHGNVGRGQLQRILSDLGAHFDRQQNSTDSKKRKHFIKRTEGRSVIYRRGSDRKITPVLVASKAPGYQPRFPFFKVAEQTTGVTIGTAFDTALQEAMATAW